MLTKSPAFAGMPSAFEAQAKIAARIERLPITRPVFWARNIIGAATFFDGYTVLAIAYAMPVLVREWKLTPQEIGMILIGRLSRPVDWRDRIRLARRKNRPLACSPVHDLAVRFDGHRLPVYLERMDDDHLPVSAGHRHRRRSAGRERVH